MTKLKKKSWLNKYLNNTAHSEASELINHESGSGFGASEGLDLSSGNGINSWLSAGGSIIRPCFQSSFACSIRSLREETKFHQMNLSPNGSPPKSMRVEFSFARMIGSEPRVNTSICPS